jgi:hypothetical protein
MIEPIFWFSGMLLEQVLKLGIGSVVLVYGPITVFTNPTPKVGMYPNPV